MCLKTKARSFILFFGFTSNFMDKDVCDNN